jgi:hypothetical protein
LIVFTGPVQISDHGRPTRRDLLRLLGAGLSAGVLAGCGLLDRADPDHEPEPDPLLPFLAGTRDLVAAYDGFLAQHPDRATRLQSVRDAHVAHAAALVTLINPPSAAPSAPASSAAVPATLAELKALESAAAKTAYDTCLAAPGRRATLLGEIATARTTHVAVLS